MISRIGKVIVLSVLCVGTLLFYKDLVCKHIVQQVLYVVLGCESSIERFTVDLRTATITAHNVKIHNLPQFQEDEKFLCDIPYLSLHLAIPEILSTRKLILESVTLHLSRFVIVRKQGTSNVKQLSIMQWREKQKREREQRGLPAPAPVPAIARRLLIKTFIISVDDVGIIDKNGVFPKRQFVALQMQKERHLDITQWSWIKQIIVRKATRKIILQKIPLTVDFNKLNEGIAAFAEKGITFVPENLSKGMTASQKVLNQVTTITTEPVKDVGATVLTVGEKVTKTVLETSGKTLTRILPQKKEEI